ncbi:MAG: hypothetical protein AB7O04_13650 [Hyphomonadaceae bacterium]
MRIPCLSVAAAALIWACAASPAAAFGDVGELVARAKQITFVPLRAGDVRQPEARAQREPPRRTAPDARRAPGDGRPGDEARARACPTQPNANAARAETCRRAPQGGGASIPDTALMRARQIL